MKAGAKPASGMRREAVRSASAVRTTPMRARTEARPAPHQPGTMAAVVPAAANPAAALQPSHAGRQPVSREEDTPLVTASVVFILLFSFLSGLLVGAFPRLPADGALESPSSTVRPSPLTNRTTGRTECRLMTTPVSSIEPSFAPLRPGSYRAAREAEDPVIRTRRMGEARM